MVGLLIILILVIAFYIGGRRGTPLQLVYTLGYFYLLLWRVLVTKA